MDQNAFNLGEEIHNREVMYRLHPKVWDGFKYPKVDLRMSKWKKIKYLNDNGDDFSTRVKYIPSDKGGLYLFFIKCDILKGMTEYPLYIGRAQFTGSQNLRKRVKEYFQKYSNNSERPLIHKMFYYWGKQLHVAYYPLNTNYAVRSIEKNLIRSLMLPMNDDIPDKKVKPAVKAFKL